MNIAGRKKEIELLEGFLQKKTSPEFVAVYGRRRVGKTYLIREVYKNQIVFECSGLHQKSMGQQLENFWLTLQEYRNASASTLSPTSWLQAFSQLKMYINTLEESQKKVVFLDEIPWFETPRSGFLAALSNFWNSYCSKRSDVILVICGSAASWIIKKVINDRGGLHNRVTSHIKLMPFSLLETKEYLEMQQVQLTLKDIVQLYMCVGGIPFYLSHVKAGKSIPQILDDLFFLPQAALEREFQNLYAALFKNSELHEQIVAALSSKNKGLSRKEIITQRKLNSGGGLTTTLKELIECNFVQETLPYFTNNKIIRYRLVDEFTLFYFQFLEKQKTKNSWLQICAKPKYKIWSGLAFENICLKHIEQIKQKLGIAGVITQDFPWTYKGSTLEKGTQIDLVIDRSDNCVNLLEFKFHDKAFEITKRDAAELSQKIQIFKEKTKTKKNVFLTFLSVFGVKKNKHYLSIVTNQLLMEDLFQEIWVLR